MGYIVSQKRKESGRIYMTPITGTRSTITSPSPFGGGGTFTDFAIAGNFEREKVYYLRFKVHKIPQYYYSGSKGVVNVAGYAGDSDYMVVQLLLKNEGASQSDQSQYPPEIIDQFTIYKTENYESSEYNFYSFVFSPSRNFNRLGFRISRNRYDAIETSTPRNWLTGENEDFGSTVIRTNGTAENNIEMINPDPEERIIWEGSDGDLCTLENIVDNANGWLKIGYQCRPGSLIVINGQPIRVGRSGIYELDNGTTIESFMIACPGGSTSTNNIDAFLLDYAYKTVSTT